MDKEQLIKILNDCAAQLYNQEYNHWYNANTMLSYEEWRSGYTQELIDSCHEMVTELMETDSTRTAAPKCKKLSCVCEAIEICSSVGRCMGE